MIDTPDIIRIIKIGRFGIKDENCIEIQEYPI